MAPERTERFGQQRGKFVASQDCNIGGMATDTEYEDLQSFLPTSGEPEASMAVYSHLALALDDIKCGRIQSADTVFAEILGELEQFNK